jgi:4-amino-4-deoxy-L-arabinose transferase-like glycosyltransferase
MKISSDSSLLAPFRDRWFLVICVLALVLGIFYNSTLLLAHDVDEARHMNYIKLLLDEQKLPYIISTQPYEEYAGAHAFHPPLYYLVLLPFYAVLRGLPGDMAWHIVRGLSFLICLAGLPMIYQIAQRVGGSLWSQLKGDNEDQQAATIFARLAVAQVALIPMFGMTANMINNDSACFLAVTLFVWLLVVKYPEDRSLKSALILGIVWGLGCLTKSTALLCNGVAFFIYLLMQEGRGVLVCARAWQRLGLAVAGVVVIAGWWHVRSFQLYGSFMPLPPSMPTPYLPSPEQGKLVMMMHDNFPFLFSFANWSMFTTLWSQKDWLPMPVRYPIYWLLALYTGVALIGLGIRWFKHKKANEPVALEAGTSQLVAKRMALWTTSVMFAVNWFTVLQVALFWHWGWADGGRYLLPSFCGLSLLLAYGWGSLLKPSGLKALTALWIVAMLAVNVTALYWLITYLNPTFG